MAEGEVQGEWTLPDRWVWTTIGDVADTTSGGTPSRKRSRYYMDGTIPWVKSGELRDGVVSNAEESITKEALDSSSARVFPKDTPLVALYGATVGRTGILGINAATNQAVCAIFAWQSAFTPEFIVYWLRFQRPQLIEMSSGGAQPNISQQIVRAFPLPLAPLPEQRRIVAAIETQFTRLDAGVAALERARANLKRYRATVLKAACEGRLVPTEVALARAEGRAYEPTDQLLARVLAERRAHWQAAHPGRRYVEPASPDVGSLPELPEGWCWATVEQLAASEPHSITDGPFGSNLKTAHYTDSGPRVIRLQNVGDGEFYDEEAHISHDHFEALRKHEIFPGDLVIAALGQSLPRACIIPAYVGPAIVKADCIRFKPHPSLGVVQYLNATLNSETLKRIAASIIHGVGRPRLNQQEVKSLPVPLPPFAEQQRIADEVERRLSLVVALEREVEAALARATRLRQAILKRAFEGRLVPQDPNDEPAAVLLERIRAERETAENGKSDRKKKRKTKKPQQLEMF